MKDAKRHLLMMVVLLALCGCGPKKLTRSLASDIMEKVASQPSIQQITVSRDQLLKLVSIPPEAFKALGPHVASAQSKKLCLPDAQDIRVITDQFEHCVGFIPPGVDWQHPGSVVKFTKSYGWKLKGITGISDDPHSPTDKIVEYTWEYNFDDLPKEAAAVLNPPNPYPGKSSLRLYDDGWRFVEYR